MYNDPLGTWRCVLAKKNSFSIVGVGASQGGYENTKAALEKLDLSHLKGRTVLIKPNAGRIAEPDSGINTSPEAVAGCADALLEAGTSSITVGESPILGVKALEALESCGIADVARKRGIELLDLDEMPARITKLRKGRALKSIGVCGRVPDFDIIVSVAVMKTHMHTGVSLSLKNIKGMLHGKEKVKLHQLPGEEGPEGRPLDIAISDLLEILRPDIGVIDGWVGLEGLGPSTGTAKPLDVAVASLDPVAADAVACRLMEIDPLSIPHIALAAKKGAGTANLEEIDVIPSDYERFASPFERPPTDIALAFPDVVIYEAGACSACISTAMLFLQHFSEELKEYRIEGGKIHVALGKDVEEVPAGTIVIGNCAAKHQNRGPFAKGCPPVASQIYKAVTGREPDGPVP